MYQHEYEPIIQIPNTTLSCCDIGSYASFGRWAREFVSKFVYIIIIVNELIQVMGSVDDAFFTFLMKSRTQMWSSSQLKNTSELKNIAEDFGILRKLHLVFQILCTIHKVHDLNFHMPYQLK